MRYIPMLMAKPGMCLAYDVYDSIGRTLISHHTILTDSFIEKLINMGIDGIYIDDKLSEGIEIQQIIDPALRAEGLACVRNKDIEKCKDVAKKIVEQMINNETCALDMNDLRSFDDYTYAHSVNVSVISCAIGLGLELSQEDLTNLVIAGLLHDLGKLEMPPEIINKPCRLTQEEYMLMKTHATLSYELVKERIDISAQVKQAVLYHHENMDGSGYPAGILGSELSELTKILHVADVYDALVSRRPYKNPYSPWEALEYLKGGKSTLFDEKIVDSLFNYIPFYPKGSTIVLSDGREAIVVDNTGERNTKPLIRFNDMSELDLLTSQEEELMIVLPSDESGIAFEEAEKSREKMIKELKRCTIYMIDLTKSSYEFLNDKLSFLYNIECFRSANMAIGTAKKRGMPDMFIVDEDDVNIDGIEEVKKIMEFTNSSIPVMVMSSSKDLQTVLKYRELSIMRYVLKPFTVVYIRSELRNLLHNFGDIIE